MLGYVAVAIVALVIVLFGAWIYVANNVEQAAYEVVTKDGLIELRDYPAFVVAEVTRSGTRGAAVNAGFRPLANYIFAKERAGDSIAMTAPVTQQRDTIAMTAPVTQGQARPDGTWTVRFIMPAQYQLETLPKPAPGDVRLSKVPAARRATIRFSGVANDALIAEQERRLRAWATERGLTLAESPTYAYYNDPFTPGPLRRNEVLFDVHWSNAARKSRSKSSTLN